MLVFSRRLPAAVLATVACFALPASAALAQTDSGLSKTTPQPQAVEPQAGKPAPPGPGETTPAVEPLPQATVTTTAPGATSGGGAPEALVTAGGAPAGTVKGSDDGGGVSWLTIAAIALAAIVLFAIVVLVLWRWRGWDPRWLRRWHHASAEAGWRLSLGWAEFRDFVRLGR